MRISGCFRRALAGLAFLAGTAATAAAQATGSVTGTISDAASLRPLEGARVRVAGTALQAITDLRGIYRLSNVPAGDVKLQVNRIGFRSVEKIIALGAGQTSVQDMALTGSAVTLEEVVVTGTAGDQSRRAQGAQIADISVSDVLKTAPVRTLEQVLQSRTTGVSVTQASGTSGAFSAIRIRGASSISLNNEPLIYVDGVQITGGNSNSFGIGGQSTGRLSELNPQDFESVEIVKGPAAATLYGANASTGVIQIITKKGRQGSSFRQTLAIGYDFLDPNFTPPNNYGRCGATLSLPTSPNPLCRGRPDTLLVSDNPLVREGGFRKGHALDVQWSGRGGGNNFSYYSSLNSGIEDGTTWNNGFDRNSGRLNFNWTPSSKLTLDAGVGLMRSTFILPDNDNNVYGYLGGGLLGTPLTRRDDNTGNNGWFGAERDLNAIRSIENGLQTHRSIATGTANYVPFDWWTHRFTVGADWLRDEAKRFFEKNSRGSYQGLSNTGDISERREGQERYTLDYLSNVRVNSGLALVHNISAGFQILSRREERIEASGQGLTVNSNNTISAAASRSATQDFTQQRQVGFLGQYQATWQDRLFATLGMRVDANSSFGRDVDWFYLPKVGLSYVLSEEPMFRENVSFLNTFRLRGAWGQTGRSPTPGAALQTFDAAPYILNNQELSGAIPRSPGNDSLKAERGIEIELGFDAGVWNDRLGIEFTYFNKTSTDLLLQKPLPPSLGFADANAPFVNIGELRNRGIEVAVNGQPIQRENLTWDMRFGLSTLDSKITDMGDVPAFNTLNRFETGFEPGMFVGLRIRSINENNVTQCGPVTYTTPGPCVIVSDDFERIGPVLPTLESNFSTDITFFKSFRLYGLVDGKFGNYLYNLTDFFRETQLVRSDRRLDPTVLSSLERLRRYGNQNGAAFVREGVKPGFPATATVNEVRDAFVQKADFVKLREVSLSYNLPVAYARYLRAQDATVTVSGRNLQTWTDYEGFDPELLSVANTNFGRQDFLTIPPSRQMSLKLNVTF